MWLCKHSTDGFLPLWSASVLPSASQPSCVWSEMRFLPLSSPLPHKLALPRRLPSACPPPLSPQQTRFSECASCTRSFLSPRRCQASTVPALSLTCALIFINTPHADSESRSAAQAPVTSAEPQAEAEKWWGVLKGQKRVWETSRDEKMTVKR